MQAGKLDEHAGTGASTTTASIHATTSSIRFSSTVSCVAVAMLVYRTIGPRELFEAAVETARTTAMLFMILVGAAMFGHALTVMRLPFELVELVTSLGVGPIVFILAVMAIVFVLGMFLETISIILITTPIVLPALGALGIDEVKK